MLMRFFSRLLLAVSITATGALSAAADTSRDDGLEETRTLAFRNLQRIVQDEERMMERARLPDGEYDVERVREGFQRLVSRYEAFLGDNPEYAPGYVAYGLMLDRAGETRIASAMFLRANQLDPNIPVVKNQLGNYMVEEGRPVDALPYYLAAIELEPEEPLYHYQLGNLLAEFRREFLEAEAYEAGVLDRSLQEAFRKASELGGEEIGYAYRYAESYYDVDDPDWSEALAAWSALENRLRPGVERQTVFLQKANIHILAGNPARAAELLEDVTAPVLRGNRDRLRERLE